MSATVNQGEADGYNEAVKSRFRLGFRHYQVLMLSLCMAILFSIRVSMSIGIVAMTDNTQNNTFDWSHQKQSIILSSFKWGYLVLKVPGGELAARYGGMVVVIGCMVGSTIGCLILPQAAVYGGWKAVCACRVLQGLSQGVIFGAAHNLISKWIPRNELSRLSTIIYAGGELGTAFQLVIAGFIAEYWGWPVIFYFNGIIGVLWTAVYLFTGSRSPQSSKLISAEERLYIQQSLGQLDGNDKRIPTPWKALFTSIAFISLIAANAGNGWGYWTILTEMPTYMRKILGVDIKSNGMLSALPYLANYIASFPLGFLSDYILKRKWLSVTASRKLFNTISSFGPAALMIALSYASGNTFTAVALLVVAVTLDAAHFTGFKNGMLSALPYLANYIASFPLGFLSDYILKRKWLSVTASRKLFNTISSFGPAALMIALSYASGDTFTAVALLVAAVTLDAAHFTGYKLVHLDMAPNHAGTMFGITSGISNVISLGAPLAAGFLIRDETDPNEWKKVFLLSAGILILTNVFFIICGTSKRQKWNEAIEHNTDFEQPSEKTTKK